MWHLIKQLLEELRKQSSMDVHISDVSFQFDDIIQSCHADFLALIRALLVCIYLQVRNALATLMSEGVVSVHGDSVKRL